MTESEVLDETSVAVQPEEQINSFFYFPSGVYSMRKPRFLDVVQEVSEESLKKMHSLHPLDDIYPVYMSDNFFADPRLAEFTEFVAKTAGSILNSQGYVTENLAVFFTEMWTQEHYKHSLMEQHVHGQGVHMVGFYFLETPEGCSKALFHDPRPSKVQINLPEANMSEATYGSNMINFAPEPGMLILTNSWLPHSFSRHASDKPIKFVHFNLGVQYIAPAPTCNIAAEVV